MTTNQSLFSTLTDRNQLLKVDVDAIEIWLPNNAQGHVAIGTDGLNSCTAIVIAGRGILMAHVSPLPSTDTSPEWNKTQKAMMEAIQSSEGSVDQDVAGVTARQHHDQFLRTIQQNMTQHQQFFPRDGTAWGIFGKSQHGDLRQIREQISSGLARLGYTMRPAWYEERDALEHKSPQGELVAFYRTGTFNLILENRQLAPRQGGSSELCTATAGSSASRAPQANVVKSSTSSVGGAQESSNVRALQAATNTLDKMMQDAYNRMMAQGQSHEAAAEALVSTRSVMSGVDRATAIAELARALRNMPEK